MNELTSEPGAATAAPAPKKNAIQLIEEEIVSFFQQKEKAVKQYEQALANVHAVEGAIQAAHLLLGKLKAEAAKAEAVVEKVVDAVEKAV